MVTSGVRARASFSFSFLALFFVRHVAEKCLKYALTLLEAKIHRFAVMAPIVSSSSTFRSNVRPATVTCRVAVLASRHNRCIPPSFFTFLFFFRCHSHAASASSSSPLFFGSLSTFYVSPPVNPALSSISCIIFLFFSAYFGLTSPLCVRQTLGPADIALPQFYPSNPRFQKSCRS